MVYSIFGSLIHKHSTQFMLSDKIQKELGVPLACLRHAASVRPGPGSNPQIVTSFTLLVKTSKARLYASSRSLSVKVLCL